MSSPEEPEEERLWWFVEPIITQKGREKPVLRLVFHHPFEDVSEMPKELPARVLIYTIISISYKIILRRFVTAIEVHKHPAFSYFSSSWMRLSIET